MGRASLAIVVALGACQQGKPATKPEALPALGTATRLGPKIPVQSRDILGLAVTPDGAIAIAVTSGLDELEREVGQHGEPGIFVWNLATGELVKKLGDVEANAFAATPDANVVAVLDGKGVVTVWNVVAATSHTLAVGANVRRIGLDDAGETLLAIDPGGLVQTWDVKSGALRTKLATVADPHAVAFSNGAVAVANAAGTILIDSLDGKAPPITIESGISDPDDLVMSRDHQRLAIVGESSAAIIQAGKVTRIPDGGQRIILLSDDQVAISSPTQGSELVVAGKHRVTLDGYGAHSRAMVEAPPGRLVAGTWSGAIRTFDLANGVDANAAVGHTSAIQTLGFFGTTLVSADGPFSPNRGLRWNSNSPSPDALPAIAVSPHFIAAARGDLPELVLQRPNAESIATRIPDRIPTHTALSDHWFAGTTDEQWMAFDIDHASWVTHRGPQGVQAIGISPDGALVALGGEAIEIYNRVTGALVRTLVKDTLNISSLVFTPDGARLVVASESEGLQLLDVASGAVVHAMVPGERGKPQGSGNTPYSAAISPDGKLIVSGHRDGSVMLWDLATGKQLASEHKHHHVVTNAAFSPDGTSIATGDQVGQIWLWKLTST